MITALRCSIYVNELKAGTWTAPCPHAIPIDHTVPLNKDAAVFKGAVYNF